MPIHLMAPARGLVAAALLLPLLSVEPAFAQIGNDPEDKAPAYTVDYFRYYAPYAMQAAAVYHPVESFEGLFSLDRKLLRENSDVNLAVERISSGLTGKNLTNVTRWAPEYLKRWKYEFGHEGYIRGCLYDWDEDCRKRTETDPTPFIPLSFGTGPVFNVWARYRPNQTVACSEVSIAFRGTWYRSDWIPNLARGLGVGGERLDDHYLQLRRNIDGIISKITGLPCYKAAKRRPQIVSVGHSLGAALALFAGLANKDRAARIVKVFAFNGSPVEGISLLNKELVKKNATRLEVDQLYQPGEGLQYARALASYVSMPTPRCLRTYAMGISTGSNPFDLHGIQQFAAGAVLASYDAGENRRPYYPPERIVACKPRYKAPTSDGLDEPPSSSEPAPQISRAPADSAVALARIDRERMIDRDVRANIFGTADLSSTGTDGQIAKLARATAPRSARTAARRGTTLAEVRTPAVRFDTQAVLLRD